MCSAQNKESGAYYNEYKCGMLKKARIVVMVICLQTFDHIHKL